MVDEPISKLKRAVKNHNVDVMEVVKADLERIASDWRFRIDEPSIRILAPTLNKLIVEGLLFIVANNLQRQLKVRINPIYLPEANPHPTLGIWMSGGGDIIGAPNMCMSIYTTGKVPPVGVIMTHKKVEKLKWLMGQPTLAIRDPRDNTLKYISRIEILKYVSNKLGGKHYDLKRKDSPLERKYELLDAHRNHTLTVKKGPVKIEMDLVYCEMYKLGQLMLTNPDVSALYGLICRELKTPRQWNP